MQSCSNMIIPPCGKKQLRLPVKNVFTCIAPTSSDALLPITERLLTLPLQSSTNYLQFHCTTNKSKSLYKTHSPIADVTSPIDVVVAERQLLHGDRLLLGGTCRSCICPGPSQQDHPGQQQRPNQRRERRHVFAESGIRNHFFLFLQRRLLLLPDIGSDGRDCTRRE